VVGIAFDYNDTVDSVPGHQRGDIAEWSVRSAGHDHVLHGLPDRAAEEFLRRRHDCTPYLDRCPFDHQFRRSEAFRNRGRYESRLGASPDDARDKNGQPDRMRSPLEQDVRLGRIAGVRIGLNWSILVAIVLFSWTLGGGVFPDAVPGKSGAVYSLMAAAGVFLLFGSIAAHELGHALQARRDGVQIDQITLWAFGGVAQFRAQLPSAAVELRVALAGPAVSVALAGLFSAAVSALGRWETVQAVVSWAGYLNLAVAIFNLVPAFPLDGGRVLRALLWRSKGDLGAATRSAAEVGVAIGYGFAILGGAMVIGGGDLGGLWLAAIGLFVVQAARAEAQQAVLDSRLGGHTVAEIMTPNPVRIRADQTLSGALATVSDARHGVYPVVDSEDRPVGVLAIRSLARIDAGARSTTPVAHLMLPVQADGLVGVDDPAQRAVEAIASSPVSRVLVVHRDHLVGLVSASDVIWLMQVGLPRDQRHLHESSRPNVNIVRK
jgi:Zn-dependent protease/CBS domain-containing protein